MIFFFQYNSTEILTNISFHLNVGDYLGIVGPNGPGKSTLIKLTLGLLQPSKGNIELFEMIWQILLIGIRLVIFLKSSIRLILIFRPQ